MGSLLRRLTEVARSPRGQQLLNQAVERGKIVANRPKNQRRIEQLRRHLDAGRRR